MKKKTVTFLILCLLLIGIKSPAVLAHNVSVFAWVEGQTVFVESKFMGGKAPKGAKVIVFDEKGNKLLEGLTNDDGTYQFKAPVKSNLKVVLEAGMGHRAEWTVYADEFDSTDESGSADVSGPVPLEDRETAGPQTPVAESGSNRQATCLSPAELETIINRAIDKKLNVINRSIAANQGTHPRFTDILGGIGYIIGLVGLAVTVQFRRTQKSSSGKSSA